MARNNGWIPRERQIMLKNGKISTELQLKKESLQLLGYAFDSISKKSGWSWSSDSDASTSNSPSEGEVIQDAWRNAGEKAQSVLNIPSETWQRMAVKEQKEMIEEAFAED